MSVFHEDREQLYHLSFLLTRNREKAEKCFVTGIENCVNENRVFKEWARSWAKRIILENAIRELKPRPAFSRSSISAAVFFQSEQSSVSAEQFDVGAVLGLEDFERFVFVMSVIEHYSHHECAILLACSLLEIRQARFHALERLADSSHLVSYTT